MPTTNVNIRMDAHVKEQFEGVVGELGISMSSAFNMFAKSVVRNERIPFEVTEIKSDPFYSPSNMAAIRESIRQLDDGESYTFGSFEELQQYVSERLKDRANADSV